ncbi:Hypothetical Protein FCC1311_018942 [Hondaea fermentalgiana]|uniref:Uncharacterized protein n=1 Tax=Hondaea fermentalgiana TaxID=2315210 RepID=A0A2R5G550_9STRA|nr:Hypothetical Protein FCC1311_018942 [Hondaea fermentalgiana]|eukprot:GBG25675.1 Hypothetical Protein FCC1311_018942 [Hondaea fermentalgiana]
MSKLRALQADIVVRDGLESATAWSPGHGDRLLMFANILQREIEQRYGTRWAVEERVATARSHVELRIDREGKYGHDGFVLQVKNQPCPFDPEDESAGTVSIVLSAGSETAMLTAIYRFIRDLRFIQGQVCFPSESRSITVSSVNTARRWSRDRHRAWPLPPPLEL